MAVRDRLFADMRREGPTQGYLSAYLTWVRQEQPESAEFLEADLIETFSTEEGLRVLKLFEKSVLSVALPGGADDRALRELNAVRNFVLEIRRIVSHGASTRKTN